MPDLRSTDRPDVANVLAPPPFIFFGALSVGFVLQILWPIHLFTQSFAARVAGGLLIVGGLALSITVMRHFGRAETPVAPWQETRRLVVSGPYRFGRNPDYVGQALLVGGLAILFDLPWALVALVPALLLVRYFVIAREERYLARRFGEEYRSYCRRVGRWF